MSARTTNGRLPLDEAAAADVDLTALRERYRHERDRRIRPEGVGQYQVPEGELAGYAEDPYSPPLTREPLHDRVEVVVLGAGLGGLVAGARLREAGVESIRLIDDAGDVGGTWYWNRYPGIHCDIESYVYMPLLDELGYVPRWKYAPGAEILEHLRAIARHYDLYRDALFQTRTTELRWDDDAAEWVVSTHRGDRIRARFVVTATGTLATVKLPRIPGIETFGGHAFHASRWDYAYTGGDQDGGLTGLAGKRVALIGTGATTIQVLPHLARDAAEVVVFQRTPSVVDVRGQRRTDPEWAASLTPGWARERQQNFHEVMYGAGEVEDLVADAWTAHAHVHQTMGPRADGRSLSDEEFATALEKADALAMNELRDRISDVVADPATAETLKPWYRYMCKRPTFSDEYLQAFNRPTVTLVDTSGHHGVTRVTETSVVVGDQEYEVDCIIFATGFEGGGSGILTARLPVHGRGGVHLFEAWMHAGGPRTLHGIFSSGFPNLCNLGPLQNGRSYNQGYMVTQQAEHVAAVIAAARTRPDAVLEPTREIEEAWFATIQEKARNVTSFLAECTPGYYNSEGQANPLSEPFGDGPVVFHELLRRWRETSMDEVIRVEGGSAGQDPAGGGASLSQARAAS